MQDQGFSPNIFVVTTNDLITDGAVLLDLDIERTRVTHVRDNVKSYCRLCVPRIPPLPHHIWSLLLGLWRAMDNESPLLEPPHPCLDVQINLRTESSTTAITSLRDAYHTPSSPGPSMAMFEVIDRTGPPNSWGPQFSTPLYNNMYLLGVLLPSCRSPFSFSSSPPTWKDEILVGHDDSFAQSQSQSFQASSTRWRSLRSAILLYRPMIFFWIHLFNHALSWQSIVLSVSCRRSSASTNKLSIRGSAHHISRYFL
jgi:hypothetical protein